MATTTKKKPLTDEQKAEKRAAERNLVEAAVEQLQTSEGWQAWITTRARFHKYSFTNQLLIAFQHPTARRVAGFKKWLELGYCVKKGEHGIRIWAPCPPTKKMLEAWAAQGSPADERPQGRSVNETIKVLIHELGHALVRLEPDPGDHTLTYAEEELMVESIAMSTCGALGFDTSSYSLAYLACWSERTDMEILEQIAAMTNRLANRIENALGLGA